MPADQLQHYTEFATRYRAAILGSPDPATWTTDAERGGPTFQQIGSRLLAQMRVLERFFDRRTPLLDFGCGFGRQAYRLAQLGFEVTGIDSCPAFVALAAELFAQHALPGRFLVGDTVNPTLPPGLDKFAQALLLDVIEHIAPPKRAAFAARLVEQCLQPSFTLLVTLPNADRFGTVQRAQNLLKRISQHLPQQYQHDKEHPFPIPDRAEILRLFPGTRVLHEDIATSTSYFVLQCQGG